MKITYNKLVRDKIPEIIKKENKEPQIKILNEKDYIRELIYKLNEESKEIKDVYKDKEKVVEEIADVLEIIDGIINFYKIDKKQLLKIKDIKRKERGGFKKKLYLKSVRS